MLPNAFWESNDKYRDQKFYTAFCILLAACSDYATSVKLKRQHLLNWSCTTSYYSIMHALRLKCFIEAGDFPTSHSKLAKLFMNNHVNDATTWIGQNPRYFPSVEPSRNFQFALNSLEDNKCLGEVLNKARSL